MIRFNEKKATQAAAKFLALNNNCMNYMILIKNLYLLDRGALLNWGRLVSYDEAYEMKWGPVLSHVHDLITEMEPEQSYWTSHICKDNFEVRLVSDPGNDALSEAEEELIAEIFATYRNYRDPFAFARKLHAILPELKGITQGRLDLTIGDILRSERRPAEEILAIEKELDSLGQVKSLYSSS